VQLFMKYYPDIFKQERTIHQDIKLISL